MKQRRSFRSLSVVVLVATSVIPASAQVPRWSLVPEQRFGGQNDSRHQWTAITALLAFPNGDIVVADRRAKTVVILDSLGRERRSLGRTGDGPGEFRALSAIGHAGSAIWITDPTLSRITTFGPLGQPERTIALRYPSSSEWFGQMAPVAMFADGSILLTPSAGSHALLRRPAAFPVALSRVDTASRLINRFPEMRLGKIGIALASGSTMTFQPFRDGALWGVSPDGHTLTVVDRTAATERRAHYRLLRYSPSGQILLDREIPYMARELERRVVDSAIDSELARLKADRGPPPPARRDIELGLYAPMFRPHVLAMVSTYDDTILLSLDGAPAGSSRWQVVDGAGVVRGEFLLSATARPYQMYRGRLWVADLDDADVPVLVRYRVITRQAPPTPVAGPASRALAVKWTIVTGQKKIG